jgi:prophage tail gpP-like protein
VAAIVADTAVPDAPLPVTVVADVLLRAAEHRTAEEEAARRTAEAVVDPLTEADRHTGVAVAADMEGKNTLDSFPA